MKYLIASLVTIIILGVASPCYCQSAVLPEGLHEKVSEILKHNGGGGGMIHGPDGRVEYDITYSQKLVKCVNVQFYHKNTVVAELSYYDNLCMYILRIKFVDVHENHFGSFIRESKNTKVVSVLDDDSESLLLPPLPHALVDQMARLVQDAIDVDKSHLLIKGKRTDVAVSCYKMTLANTTNYKANVEYYPSYGFFRWTKESVISNEAWNYVLWPKN